MYLYQRRSERAKYSTELLESRVSLFAPTEHEHCCVCVGVCVCVVTADNLLFRVLVGWQHTYPRWWHSLVRVYVAAFVFFLRS